MFESLDEFLVRQSAQGELWFFPPPGNAGDALIATASWQRFRRLGLKVHPIPLDGFDATGKIVLFGGGGNLVPLYPQGAAFLARHHKSAKHLAVLPHTFDGHRELLSELGPNVTLFCREKVSHRHCLAHAPNAATVLSHDLALELDIAPLLPPGPIDWARLWMRAAWVTVRRGRSEGVGLRDLRRIRTFLTRHGLRSPDDGLRPDPVLHAFRADAESTGRPLPPDNMDLSELLKLPCVLRSPLSFSAACLLGCLRGYQLVRTDRLHVCIAAALLGIQVEFYPNSYFKCQAIWEHSLNGSFPTIRWMD